MDFEPTAEAVEAASLTATILADHCTPERLREIDSEDARFDPELWGALGEAGLVGLSAPEEYDGSELGLIELCSVLVEIGRTVAPVPLGTHVVTAMALAQFGTRTQQARWLPGAATGASILTSALSEDRQFSPSAPVTRAENDGSSWLLTGSKTAVPAGTLADMFVLPAGTAEGLTVFLVHVSDPGVTLLSQKLSDGDTVGLLELDRAAIPMDRVLGSIGNGAEVCEWLIERMTLAVCAQQLGTLDGALGLTADYAKSREQFGRPIGTFQAVSQRLADGYIDALGARLTMWQAAWKLSEGLPATADVAIAKLWAADAGHRIAHTTVHVHGGVGIDLDGEAHRYFTAAKRHEFTLGGTTDQSRTLGALLAHEPA
ncbi:MAG: acyl-CoA dehydrogenase family protein [Marmoricola sp.]